jgi:hypothetical protein
LICKDKNEVLREAAAIALERFVQAMCGNLIKLGQIRIEDDFLAPDEVDFILNHWRRGDDFLAWHEAESKVFSTSVNARSR